MSQKITLWAGNPNQSIRNLTEGVNQLYRKRLHMRPRMVTKGQPQQRAWIQIPEAFKGAVKGIVREAGHVNG
jgi:hypothetical protein